MIDRNCGTCDFGEYVENNFTDVICRRYPPITHPVINGPKIVGGAGVRFGQISIFPLVGKLNWCGEWKDGIGGKNDRN